MGVEYWHRDWTKVESWPESCYYGADRGTVLSIPEVEAGATKAVASNQQHMRPTLERR
jgi:hypothetical protein